MKNCIDLETAKLLKEVGFDKEVPHCYIHYDGEYKIHLFAFLTGVEDYFLNLVFGDIKKDINHQTYEIYNEYEIYFNYNRDIRKLIAKVLNGIEYMDDEKCYNMSIDSYTYYNLPEDEREELKYNIPNYNDGDFVWDVYADIMSAPSYSEVCEWLLEKYQIWIKIIMTQDFKFYNSVQNAPVFDINIYNSPQEAYNGAIKEILNKKCVFNR